MLPMRMNAAETSASSAIADWTPLTVVSRSSTTAEIDTFMSDVSTTRTNIAIASSSPSRGFAWATSAVPASIAGVGHRRSCSIPIGQPGSSNFALAAANSVIGQQPLGPQPGQPLDLRGQVSPPPLGARGGGRRAARREAGGAVLLAATAAPAAPPSRLAA